MSDQQLQLLCTAREPWAASVVNSNTENRTESAHYSVFRSKAVSDSAPFHVVRGWLRTGFLVKQGEKRKNWKRRFFGLSHSGIEYFASDIYNGGAALGHVALADISHVSITGRRITHRSGVALMDEVLDDTLTTSNSAAVRLSMSSSEIPIRRVSSFSAVIDGEPSMSSSATLPRSAASESGAGSHGWGWQIYTARRTFMLAAETERERTEWVNAVNVQSQLVRAMRTLSSLIKEVSNSGKAVGGIRSSGGRFTLGGLRSSGSRSRSTAISSTTNSAASSGKNAQMLPMRLESVSAKVLQSIFEIQHAGCHVLEAFRDVRHFSQASKVIDMRRLADLANLIPSFRDGLLAAGAAAVSFMTAETHAEFSAATSTPTANSTTTIPGSDETIGSSITYADTLPSGRRKISVQLARISALAVNHLGILLLKLVKATDPTLPHAPILIQGLEQLEVVLREFRTCDCVTAVAAARCALTEARELQSNVFEQTCVESDVRVGAGLVWASFQPRLENVSLAWRNLAGDAPVLASRFSDDSPLGSSSTALFQQCSSSWQRAATWLESRAVAGDTLSGIEWNEQCDAIIRCFDELESALNASIA